MPLTAGTRLGPYEIVEPIGAGGMGEVYKARDTRLNRIVAVKISKEQFTERFEREARAVAALNHPHICHLYDVGPNFLVMEWVDGENLKGPLPLDEAMRIAEQIAEALGEAHEKGIVHRDLKPANIKVTQDGSVKVLDFGLAKVTPAEAGATSEDSPTLSLGATKAGMILGTAAYMAPEQARGKPADKRADIWAFGVVLYEILTGERLFKGEDTGDILAAVIKEQPDLSRAPEKLRPLLKSCLEKDRRKRLQAIGDWKLLLAGQASGVSPAQVGKQRPNIFWPAIAALAILAAAALSFLYFRETPPVEPVLRLSIPLPENFNVYFLALSPDGRTLAITASSGNKIQLWLRTLDSLDLRPLANSEGARNPFWSPDGRFLGFFADGKLKTVPVSGGPATPLCDGGTGGGGAWNRDGVILFGSGSGPLQRVNAAGGACSPITEAEPGMRHLLPEFLPDGRHFLYLVQSTDPSKAGLYLAALDRRDSRRLLPDQSSAILVPRRKGEGHDHLLFQRENKLVAQPFNAETFELAGDPSPVAPQLSQTLTPGQVAASASGSGPVVYLAGPSQNEFQLTWMDRAGKELGKVGPLGGQRGLALSPDQKTIALGYIRNGSRSGLWLRELARDVESRLALSPFGAAVWSPESNWIVFATTKGLYRMNAHGGPEEPLLPSDRQFSPSDWSHDGKYLLYTDADPKTRGDIWVLPLDASGKPGTPAAFLKTEFNESQGQFSPDGHWVAYVSNESGPTEVYVRPFPSGAGATRISNSGGSEPRWRSNGEELYYLTPGNPRTLTAVSVKSRAGQIEIGVPKPLLTLQTIGIIPEANDFSYSPAGDGQRFLMNVLPGAALPTLNVITNWEKAAAAK